MEFTEGAFVQAPLVHHEFELYAKFLADLPQELQVAVDARVHGHSGGTCQCEGFGAGKAIDVSEDRGADFKVRTGLARLFNEEGVGQCHCLNAVLLVHIANESDLAIEGLLGVPIPAIARGIHRDVDADARLANDADHSDELVEGRHVSNAARTGDGLRRIQVDLPNNVAVASLKRDQLPQRGGVSVVRNGKLELSHRAPPSSLV